MNKYELWQAWSICQSARDRWLIADPLQFSEFEMIGLPPAFGGLPPAMPELEFVTRPKQSGGVRLEVFPDAFSSTLFQYAANRIIMNKNDSGPALSMRSMGMRIEGRSAYEAWSSSVIPWLTWEISQQRAVLIVDVHNFFGSISRDQIAAALREIPLEVELHEELLRIIDEMNAISDLHGRTRSGLPVAPNDLFWVLADLVFSEIDAAIERIPGVESYVRWIDDMFISLKPAHADRVLNSLNQILGKHGFHLNESKTLQLNTVSDFEKIFYARDHNDLDMLFRASKADFLPVDPEYFPNLLTGIEGNGIRQDRIVKRIYSLASKTRASSLLSRVELDLANHPTAELAILGYLGSLGWPGDSIVVATQAIRNPATDSRLLGAMRMLIRCPPPIEKRDSILSQCREILTNIKNNKHPYSVPLALGFLLDSNVSEATDLAVHCLDIVPGLMSATARRVSCEILRTIPETKDQAYELIMEDPSPTVSGLRHFLKPKKKPAQPLRLRSTLVTGSSQRLSWGRLTTVLAKAMISSELLGDNHTTNFSVDPK